MAKQSLSKQNSIEVDADVSLLPGAGILLADDDAPALKSSSPKIRTYGTSPAGVISWGPNNALPQTIIANCNQSPELLSLLDYYHTVLYGAGLYYEVYDGVDKTGKHVWKEAYDSEVEDWMAFNQVNESYLDACVDFAWFNHTFPELIKNKRGNKIAQITTQEASFCRFGFQNDEGYSDKVFINANWPRASATDALTIPVTALDPSDLFKVQRAMAMPDDKFILPVSYPMPGCLIYQAAGWHSIFPAGWFKLSKLIPVLKLAMMQFQMVIKFLIEVPQRFWELRAEDIGKVWKDMSPAEKKRLKRDVSDEINKFLVGAENAGKSFMSTFGIDPKTGQKIPGVTITALDDKIKDGKYIEDGKEASSQFRMGVGIPSTLINSTGSGSDMGAGSGTDARVHYDIFSARLDPRRMKILAPYNFAAQFNGWTQRMAGFRFNVRKIVIDSLSVNHQTANPAPSTQNG